MSSAKGSSIRNRRTGTSGILVDADWMVSTAAQDPEEINLSIGYGTDVALFGYGPDRLSGKRANADYVADAGDAGVDEQLVLTAPLDGSYAVVVVNDNAQPSTFTFAAEITTTPGIFSDGFESGDTSGWSATMGN
ncbi:MAG: hypothetical protein GY842_27095 [bacterium]|nr:hypothetical protein [bacterium]